MCCGVVPILFGWFLRVPSLHALVFIENFFVTCVTTVHPQLSKPRLSDTLIIQIQNLSSHTHIYKGHVQNGVFQLLKATRSAENVLIIEEKLDICKLMATDKSYTERYRSRRSTIVAKFSKKMDDMGMNKKGV